MGNTANLYDSESDTDSDSEPSEWIAEYGYLKAESELKINGSWEIYTKKGCMYSTRARNLLDEMGIEYKTIDVTEKNRRRIYRTLDKVTNRYRYFPMIFNEGNFIGGFDELSSILTRKGENLKLVLPPIGKPSRIRYLPDKYRLFAVLLFLSRKFENDCVILPIKSIFPWPAYIFMSTHSPFMELKNITLHWDIEEKEFIVPDGYWDHINACKSKKRFVLMPFIFSPEERGHMNFIIYDFKTRSMERFEPHGVDAQDWLEFNIDLKLQNLFTENMGQRFIMKYYRPIDYCPIIGPQTLQDDEEEDTIGYCMAWSFWYAELRLSNPEKTRDEVVALAMKELDARQESLTQFIKNYSNPASEYVDQLSHSKNLAGSETLISEWAQRA